MRLGLEQAVPTGRDAIESLLHSLLCSIWLAGLQKTFREYQKLVLVIKASNRLACGPDRILHGLQALGHLTGFEHRPAQKQRAHDEHVATLVAPDADRQLGKLAARIRPAVGWAQRRRP